MVKRTSTTGRTAVKLAVTLLLFFSLIFTVSPQAQCGELSNALMCTKDWQARFIFVEKTKHPSTPFVCQIKKLSETVISGMFAASSEAQSCVEQISRSFSELGWKCQPTEMEYLWNE